MNFNTARFFLSRLESLSAAPTSLSFLRFRSKSSKSSEGVQGETVSSVSAFFQSSLRSSFKEAVTPATDSPDTRISIGAFVVLSDYLCPWRKDPYLPSRPLSVRHLPRHTGLPPMAFAVSFRIRFADAKTAGKHHRPETTDIRPKAPADSDRHHTPGRKHRRDIYKQCDRSPDRTSFEIPLNHL